MVTLNQAEYDAKQHRQQKRQQRRRQETIARRELARDWMARAVSAGLEDEFEVATREFERCVRALGRDHYEDENESGDE